MFEALFYGQRDATALHLASPTLTEHRFILRIRRDCSLQELRSILSPRAAARVAALLEALDEIHLHPGVVSLGSAEPANSTRPRKKRAKPRRKKAA